MTTASVPSERLTLSVESAARALGISENSLRTALHNPSEPINKIVLRVGRRYLISRKGLEALLAGASGEPPAQPGEGETK